MGGEWGPLWGLECGHLHTVGTPYIFVEGEKESKEGEERMNQGVRNLTDMNSWLSAPG